MTAAVVTYFQPVRSQSSVFVEVKSTAQNLRIFSNMGDPSLPIHDPQLAPTVFQIIQRTGILYPVIDDLEVAGQMDQRWHASLSRQAYQMLRGKLNVEEVRNTDLLQISVLDVDPQRAADIANKIVAVYQDKRVEEEKDIMNRAVATMNEEVEKQRRTVAAAEAEVSRIRDEEHIVDLNRRAQRTQSHRLTRLS